MLNKGEITESQAKELAQDAEEIDLTPEEVEINMRTTTMVDVVPDSKKSLPLEFMIGKTKHFRNGNYKTRDDKYDDIKNIMPYMQKKYGPCAFKEVWIINEADNSCNLIFK